MKSTFSDYEVSHHGSVSLLYPLSKAAREHLEEHVGEEAQWHGSALVVEPRYLSDIVDELRENGWRVA